MTRVRLRITGMSCGHCVARVEQALASTEGVAVRAVGIGAAEVEVDEGRQTVAAVLASVEEAGYEAALEADAQESR